MFGLTIVQHSTIDHAQYTYTDHSRTTRANTKIDYHSLHEYIVILISI